MFLSSFQISGTDRAVAINREFVIALEELNGNGDRTRIHLPHELFYDVDLGLLAVAGKLEGQA